MSKRIGCLTNSGILSAILTLLIVTIFGLTRGNHMFSPGELNSKVGKPLGGVTSHAEIGDKCSRCHSAPWDSLGMNDRCQQCHEDIASQLQDKTTLHGILFIYNLSLTCRLCHPEHSGPSSPQTVMNRINFPHETLGFSLNSHKKNLCQDCHPSSIKNFTQEICISCHKQIDQKFMQAHTPVFGSSCLACHDGIDAYGKSFDHNDFVYKLSGIHKEIPCIKCHTGARSKSDLLLTPQECSACHLTDNIHSVGIGISCGDCHTPDGWKPAKFDHNLANYKLEGKHISVPCEKCHTDGEYIGTPLDCAACHTNDDAHQGEYGTNCGDCHSIQAWTPATFDHSLSAFPLTGAHINSRCVGCHINKVFKGTPLDCYSCHGNKDAHNGSFGKDCSACHTTSGWLPVTFDHALSSFPLTGAHVNLVCSQCHPNYNFKNASAACISCHGDPAWHAGSFGTNCASCHTTSNWSASYSGSHPSSCEGQCINHERASCKDCHPVNVNSSSCTKCHESNNPGGDD